MKLHSLKKNYISVVNISLRYIRLRKTSKLVNNNHRNIKSFEIGFIHDILTGGASVLSNHDVSKITSHI